MGIKRPGHMVLRKSRKAKKGDSWGSCGDVAIMYKEQAHELAEELRLMYPADKYIVVHVKW